MSKQTAWPADKVERRKVASLVPYARNARTHSPEQVDQIAASIREWGWTTPVLIDEKSTIIAGHGRVLAAQKLGVDEIPVMVAKGWTEAQRKAYTIADNQLGLTSGWNDDLLKVEIEDLLSQDFDVSILGWGENIPDFAISPDYSILDEADMSGQLDDMAAGVKKAIQIEFEPEHYEEAQELVKFWRAKGSYIGYMIIGFLRAEKAKLK